jgi:hypothetical protein
LFVLTLAGLWYSQYQEEQAELKATPTAAPARILFTGSIAPVRIQLGSADGRSLELVDKGIEGWQIVEPALGVADSTQVAELINSLLALEVASELDPSPSDEEMGLTNPAYVIQLSWQDGRVQILQIGSQTPTSSRYYAKLDGGKAVLISIYGLTEVQTLLDSPPVVATSTIQPTSGVSATAQP